MNFRLTKGNFLKTGAYIEGDSAVFTFAAEKEDVIAANPLLLIVITFFN